MAIQIKDTSTLQQKYVQRGSNAVTDYKAGINAPKNPQAASAIAAAPRWQAALADPNAVKRYTNHLQKSGEEGWKAGALNKGANNYPSGITRGAPKWAANVQPYLDVIKSVTLSVKGIRGSSANLQRVADVANALHAKKVSMAGG
jgi:hypothetical protein